MMPGYTPMVCRLAGRPGQRAAAEDVRVHVTHRLAAVGAGVEHDPVPAVGHSLRDRDPVGLGRHLGQQAPGGRRHGGQVGVVLTRDDQDMDRGLRVDIAERYSALALHDFLRRDLTGNDAAKETLRHRVILTCASPSGALTYMVTLLRTHDADAPTLWCAVSSATVYFAPARMRLPRRWALRR